MFVRTKDWIYDTENLHYRWIENNKVYKVGWDVEKPTFEADIIKQSENLAELCDEFVCYGNNTYSLLDRITTIDKYAVFKDKSAGRVSDLIKVGCKFYGAIWTDKGLIYVAKMNDKGELELI